MPRKPQTRALPLGNDSKMIRKTRKKSNERGIDPNPIDSDKDTMRAPASYRLALKALRNRAQLTLEDCAKAVGLGTTGFQRYENDKKFDSEPVPVRIIRGLIPVMTGKGNPPIEEAELWNLSEMRDQAPAAATRPDTQLSSFEASDFSDLKTGRLPIRYVVERGVFRSVVLAQPHFGSAMILPTGGWDQGLQWAARVIGPDGLNFRMPSGTLLHCIDPDAVPLSTITDGRLVVAERVTNKLSEILLARVIEMTGRRTARLRDSDGQDFTGDVLGLIMFQYSPVS